MVKCKICGRKFDTKKGLALHKSRIHEDSDRPEDKEPLSEGRVNMKVYDGDGNLKEEQEKRRVSGEGAIELKRNPQKNTGKKGKKFERIDNDD